MLRYQLGPSPEFIVNVLLASSSSDAFQRRAFGKACLRGLTCAKLANMLWNLVAMSRGAETSPAKCSNPTHENPAGEFGVTIQEW